MRKYKFFSHFNRINMQRGNPKVWTVHFKGQCIPAEEIEFRVPLTTVYKPEGKQPRATLQGFATSVTFEGEKAIVA